jgi:hypothetical protein
MLFPTAVNHLSTSKFGTYATPPKIAGKNSLLPACSPRLRLGLPDPRQFVRAAARANRHKALFDCRD